MNVSESKMDTGMNILDSDLSEIVFHSDQKQLLRLKCRSEQVLFDVFDSKMDTRMRKVKDPTLFGLVLWR